MRALFLALILVCVFTPSSEASQQLPLKGTTAQVMARSETSREDLAALREQVRLLKRQLDITRGFQSDMLQTVYFCLTFLAALAVLLVGYNWFTNFRIYQREKQSLLEALTSEMTTRITQVEQTLRAESQSERERSDRALEQVRSDIRARIDETTGTLREAMSTRIDSLGNSLSQLVDKSNEVMRFRVGLVDLRVTNEQLSRAIEQKSYYLAVSLALDLIEDAIKIDFPYYAERGLELLSTALVQGGKPTEEDLKKAPELLSRVPEKLRGVAEEVLAKMSSAGAA